MTGNVSIAFDVLLLQRLNLYFNGNTKGKLSRFVNKAVSEKLDRDIYGNTVAAVLREKGEKE